MRAAADDLGRRITDRSGRTLSGQTLDAFYALDRARAGRSASASTARSARARCGRTSPSCRASADGYVSCYPNAGLPNAFGEYDEQPAETGGAAQGVRARAASSTSSAAAAAPRPITSARSREPVDGVAAAAAVRGRRRRRLRRAHAAVGPRAARASRPDSNFQMIGERTNVTGSKKFERLVKASDWAGAVDGGARPGARRRQHHRRQHGRGHARLRSVHDRRSSTTSPPSPRSRACR